MVERPGLGLELEVDGIKARLGRPDWVGGGETSEAPPDELWFRRAAGAIVRFDWTEELRPGTARAIGALSRRGLELWIASGDAAARTRSLAGRVQIPEARVRAGMNPEQKAELVRSFGEATLMIGDGLNDAPALAAASLSGTPAVDRPWLPSAADFYLTTPSIEPVGLAFALGDRLRRVVRTNWVFFGTYNALVVSLAIAGWMSPLACAVVMPLSSVCVLAMTAFQLGNRRLEALRWKS